MRATPTGTYRFVLDGHHRSAVGEVTPYQLTSDAFEVDVWRGITANLQLDDGASTYRFGPIDYPDTCDSSFSFVSGARERFSYRSGIEDDQFFCRFCRTRGLARCRRARARRRRLRAAGGRDRRVGQHPCVGRMAVTGATVLGGRLRSRPWTPHRP